MAAPIPDFQLILSGILRRARGMADPMAWLQQKHGEALDATLAGDEFVNTTSDEGGSAGSMREMPANTLLQLYELAMQALEAESSGSTAAKDVRYADFSFHPCVLG